MLRRLLMAGATAGGLDPPLSNVAVLLRFNGANNSTLCIDEMGNQWVGVNQAKISTTQSKFGGSSGAFDGASDYFDCKPADNSRLAFGTGDFAIEAWIYVASLSTRFVIFDSRDAGNNNGVMIYIGGTADGASSGAVIFEMRSSSPPYAGGNGSPGGAVSLNTWTHVAVSREGNFYRMFVDGVLQTGSGTNGSGTGWDYTNGGCRVGHVNDNNAAYSANGYIDEVRVTKGVALYTAAFSPPSAQFPGPSYTDANSRLVGTLLHFDGVDGSTTFTESALKAKTWTPSGNAQIDTAFSKFGGASGLFDGTGDYLVCQPDTGFDFAVLDFTIEFWIKTTQTNLDVQIIGRDWVSAPWTGAWSLYINSPSSGSIRFYAADYSTSVPLLLASSVTYNDGNWHHIAIVRNGTSFFLYVDGNSVATATDSFAFVSVAKPVTIANDTTFGSGARAYNGSLDELRITRGLAVYTSNFTPPVAAFAIG